MGDDALIKVIVHYQEALEHYVKKGNDEKVSYRWLFLKLYIHTH